MAKYCSKCNKFFDNDEIKFCINCGCSEFIQAQAEAPVPGEAVNTETIAETAAEAAEPASEPIKSETEVATEPVSETATEPVSQAATEPEAETATEPATEPEEFPKTIPLNEFNPISIEEPAVPPKKKKRILKIALFTLIPAALIAVIAFNFSFLYGWAIRIFGSDASYLKYVETKAFESYADNIGDALNSGYLNNQSNKYATSEAKIKVNKNVDSIMKKLGADWGIGWLNDTTIRVDSASSGDEALYKLLLSISNQDVLAADFYIDSKNSDNGVIYLSIKDITDKVLRIDTSKLNGNAQSSALYADLIAKAAPDSKLLKELISKYVSIALDDITDVSSESETVSIGDASQKLLVIEYKVGEKTALKILRDVIKEAKNDSDIKGIIYDAQDVLLKHGIIKESDDIYDELINEFDNLLNEIDNMIDRADNSDPIIIRDYVNNSHKIVGRKISMGNNEFEYIAIEDGDDNYCKVNVNDNALIDGRFNKDGDILNGEFDITVSGEKVATIKVSDFNTNFKGADLCGKINIRPDTKFLKKNIPASYAMMVSMIEPELELDFSTNGNGRSINIKLLGSGQEIIGIYSTSKPADAMEIEKPKGDILNANDNDEVLWYVSSFDLTKLTEKLRKTSMPEAYISQIEALGKAILSTAVYNSNSYYYDGANYAYDGLIPVI